MKKTSTGFPIWVGVIRYVVYVVMLGLLITKQNVDITIRLAAFIPGCFFVAWIFINDLRHWREQVD